MLYKVVSGVTLGIASLSILTQIVLLPLIFQYSVNIKNDFQARMRKFHYNARTFDNQLNQIQKFEKIGLFGKYKINADQRRFKRQLEECSFPYPGPQGPPGDTAPDGEPGEPGENGASGIDAYQLLLEEAQKCVECPTGPIGPVGAPGQQGFSGVKGDKGYPGVSGRDGVDGEQGLEGYIGSRGISGKKGKKGVDGAPAPGGQGPPGPPGVKGPLGNVGQQGERGRRNYVIGSPGGSGRPGKSGTNGIEGKAGIRGEKGEKGEPGADARFCPCPLEMNVSGSKNVQQSSKKATLYRAQQSYSNQQTVTLPVTSTNLLPSDQNTQPLTIPTEVLRPKPDIKQLPLEEHKNPLFRRPTTGLSDNVLDVESVTSSNTAYEDAYPNYEGEHPEKNKNNNNNYDDDDDTNNRGQAAEDNSPLNDGDVHNLGNPLETIAHRRFSYVTKRPKVN